MIRGVDVFDVYLVFTCFLLGFYLVVTWFVFGVYLFFTWRLLTSLLMSTIFVLLDFYIFSDH